MYVGLDTISGLSQTPVAGTWGCYANHWHSWSSFGEHNEAVFQRAIIKFRQKEGTAQTKKVIRHVYSQFDFDLENRDLYCQLDCVVCFPLRGRAISVYSILGSSTFLLDVVNIKGKISSASYKTLIPFSICPSSSLIHILQRQMGI